MPRPTEKHSDPIVRDLQAIRRLRWSQPEDFRALETLLTHPLIAHFAFQPKKQQQRVKALEVALREVIDRIQRREGEEPPMGRSVAEAGTALLRLSPEFERMSLEEIRAHIAAAWGKLGGGSLTPNGFRQHLEVSGVYEPLAAEFRIFAREQSEDYSKASPDEEIEAEGDEPLEIDGPPDFDPSSGSVVDALRAMELRLYRNRLVHIDEGMLRIRSEEEMLGVLVALTNVARHEFRAVDYVDVSEWFSSPRLNAYLMTQLERVKAGRDLLRIRIVRDEELQYESRSREQLERLIDLHRSFGAELLLCREAVVEKSKLQFAPHVGLLVIDAGTAPVAVTGKLAGDGSIGRARVYIGETDELRGFKKEFKILEDAAREQDRELRAELHSLR